MNKVRYCLPIISSSTKEVRQKISQYGDQYDFLEVWVDYLVDRKSQFLREIALELPGKMIFLFRRKNLEPIQMRFSERCDVIDALEGTDSFLDLDICHQEKELAYLEQKPRALKTILSYHNYLETPSSTELQEIVKQILERQPNICKVTALCQDERAVLRLLATTLELKEKHQKYIVLGMGELGKITRIIGTIWGNEMIFAPENGHESAPGQLTREELQNIFQSLGIER